MTVVQHTLTDPTGQPVQGYVSVALTGAGLNLASRSQVVAETTTQVAQDGVWSQDLVPNSPGEFYRVTIQPAAGQTRIWDVVVPLSASALWLGSLLLTQPVPPRSPLAGLLRGESAYEIAVRNGFVGTEVEWLASLKGTGSGSAAGLADRSVTEAKLSFDPATQTELSDAVTALSQSLATKVNSSTYVQGIAGARDRANHSGQQPASSISDFTAAVEAIVRAYLAANGGGGGTGGGTTPPPTASYLLAENGDFLTTESGDRLVLA